MKILIIDDHRLFADGIKNLLQTHDKNIFIEYASNVLSANEQITCVDTPNLILLGVNDTTAINNLDLFERLNQLKLEIPVLVISCTDHSSVIDFTIENYASGFISKNCSRKTTLDAILSVLDGKEYNRKPKNHLSENNRDTDKITTRQQEVLLLLSQGLLNKQIAYELDISANTVKSHLHDLFKHLHVNNRTAAVKYGHDFGLI